MNEFEEKTVHAPDEDSQVLPSPASDSEGTSTDFSEAESKSEGASPESSASESESEGGATDLSASEKNEIEKTTSVPPVPGREKSRKKIAAVILALVLAGAAAVFFGYSGWVQFPWMENRVFWNHGRLLKEGWIRMPDGAYCYFGADGEMVTGLQLIGEDRYYFDPDSGEMKTGWMTIPAAAAEGAVTMESAEKAVGTTAEEAAVSATAEKSAGAMVEKAVTAATAEETLAAEPAADRSGRTEGNTSEAAAASQTASPQEDAVRMYFRSPSGKAAVGWEEINGDVYGFSDRGILQTGWIERDGQRYYLDELGRRQTGWQTIDEETYYLGDDGAMQTGWVQVGRKTYLLDEKGHKMTGRQTVNGKKYRLNADGVLLTGWIEERGERYYYGPDGSLQTGFVTIGGERYYLSEDGTVEPGWHWEDDSRFYVCSDGFVLDAEEETGDYGRFVVRGTGLDVCLFTAPSREEYQTVVDNENSALVVQERRDLEPVIADRRSQGFDMKRVKEGSIALVLYPDGTVQEFTCSRRTTGSNIGSDVVDEAGLSIWKQNEGGLCTYSSAGGSNSDEVIVCFWTPVLSGTEEDEG